MNKDIGLDTVKGTSDTPGTAGRPRSKFALLRSKGFVNQTPQNHSRGDADVKELGFSQRSKTAYKIYDNKLGFENPVITDELLSSMLRKIWLGFQKPQQQGRVGRLTFNTHLDAIVEVSEEEEQAAMVVDHCLLVGNKGGRVRTVIRRIRKLFNSLFKPNKIN